MQRILLFIVFTVAIFSFLIPSKAYAVVEIKGEKGVDLGEQNRRYGPIKDTDTLWQIAKKVRPSDQVTMYQVMMALYEKNPNGFLDNNFNHLNTGQFLIIPTIREIQSISAADAQYKAESDDKVWAKKQRGEKIGKEINLVKLQTQNAKKADLNQAKSELQRQISELQSKQVSQLGDLKQQVDDSKITVEKISDNNIELDTKLEKITVQLNQLQSQLGEEQNISAQMQEILMQQSTILQQQQEQLELARKQNEGMDIADLWQSIANNPLMLVALSTIPAVFILGFFLLWQRRKKQKQTNINQPNYMETVTAGSAGIAAASMATANNAHDEFDLDLDSDLGIDEADLGLSEDDNDLNLDLNDEESEEEAVRLDDDADDILYEDTETAANTSLEEERSPNQVLEQDELDDLLSSIDEIETPEKTKAPPPDDPNAILSQDDLSQLFAGEEFEGLGIDNSPSDEANNTSTSTNPVEDELEDDFDIDALIDAQQEDPLSTEESPDAGIPKPEVEENITDNLDQIDQILGSDINNDLSDNETVFDADLDAEFNIDELLEDEDLQNSDNEKETADDSLAELETEDEDETEEIDIDSLLEQDAALNAQAAEAAIESTDDFDIDSLLDSASNTDSVAKPEPEAAIESTDDFDIDSLLDSASHTDSVAKPAPEAAIESTDDFDIDSLFDAEKSEPAKEQENNENVIVEDLSIDDLAALDNSIDLFDLDDGSKKSPELTAEEQDLEQVMTAEFLDSEEDKPNANNVEADNELRDQQLNVDPKFIETENNEQPVDYANDNIEQDFELPELLEDEDLTPPSPPEAKPSRELEEYPELTFDDVNSSTEEVPDEQDEDDWGDELDNELAEAEVEAKTETEKNTTEIPEELSEENILADLTESEFDAMLSELTDDDLLLDIATNQQESSPSVTDKQEENLIKEAPPHEDLSNFVDIDDLLTDDDSIVEELYSEDKIDEALKDLELTTEPPKEFIEQEFSAELDLAQAYIEMDETEGANELLQKVLQEGSDVAKKEAEKLLKQIK